MGRKGILKTFVLETAPNSWKNPEPVSMYDLGNDSIVQTCNQLLYNIRLAVQWGFPPLPDVLLHSFSVRSEETNQFSF